MFCPGLYLSASLASGARRMATHCPFYTAPKSAIISIFELLSDLCAANWTLVSLNTFCHSMPVRESHYAYTIFTLLHTPILPLLDTPLSQFKGSACNREERTGSSRLLDSTFIMMDAFQ